MPVVEYKMHVVTNKGGATAPLWVDDGGYHTSPIDKTKVGWVLADSDREYYVPDTVVELSKTDFINRQLAIHAVVPISEVSEDSNGQPTETLLDSSEVTATMGTWYDNFVHDHTFKD